MEWQVEYLSDARVVRVTTSGPMSLLEILQMAQEALAEVKSRSASRVLIDHRNATPVLKILEIYRLPDSLLALGMPRELKVATVYAQDSSTKDFEFYENVSFNLGLEQVLFVDPEAALRWLLTEPG